MVDPTKGIGPIPGVTQTGSKPAARDNERSEKAERSGPRDSVEISKEALSLQEAEKKAAETRETLSRSEDLTLGLDPDFDRDEA